MGLFYIVREGHSEVVSWKEKGYSHVKSQRKSIGDTGKRNGNGQEERVWTVQQ